MIRLIYCCFLLFIFSQGYAQLNEPAREPKSHQKGISRPQAERPYVVLISIDGLRHDYVERFGAKHLMHFAESGVRATKMMPVFPSSTFPNHYSIATGMYPKNHGILSNNFYSRERKRWYSMKDASTVTDGSWYGGEPIWNLAERAGIRSGICFWIGSEAEINGIRPTYYLPYDGRMMNQSRFDQVEQWLQLPEEKRPHFIAAYFSTVDHAGHRYGPDSKKTQQAVLDLDSLFGVFLEKMEAMDLPINIIVVSDHGMSDVRNGIVLSELINLEGCEVSYSFPPMIYCGDSTRIKKIVLELKNDQRFDVFAPDECPEHWQIDNRDGVGDLILNVEAPYIIMANPKPVSGGTHGYDAHTNDEMKAYFAAKGVNFKQGVEISEFENIHLYPMIAEILGLQPLGNIDGELKVLQPLLIDKSAK